MSVRRQEILEFITRYIRKYKYSPSYGEIGKQFGLTSLATVHKHVQILIELGELQRREGLRKRNLVLPEQPKVCCPKCKHKFIPHVLMYKVEQPLAEDKCGIKLMRATERLSQVLRGYTPV